MLKIQVCTPVPNAEGTLGPMHGSMNVDWIRARMDLVQPFGCDVLSTWQCGFEVGDARNRAAEKVLEDKHDFLFFLDWDVLAHPQTMDQLFQRALNNPDIDVFSGVYCCRNRDYPAPLLYTGDNFQLTWDWTVGDVLTTEEHELTGFGMGCCLIRSSIFKRLKGPWFQTTPGAETEDLYFLRRARKEVGAQFLADCGLLAWHQAPESGLCSGLPYDCAPVKRWRAKCRAADPSFPEGNVMPYRCDMPRMNIGQKVTNCQEMPHVGVPAE